MQTKATGTKDLRNNLNADSVARTDSLKETNYLLSSEAYVKALKEGMDDTAESHIFTPVKRHVNVFATSDWKNYDYQRDISNDPKLQAVKPVGKE